MNLETLARMAAENGFDRVYALKPVYAERPAVHRLNQNVADDPETLLPGVKTTILLLKAYAPYRETPGEATISAYYPASHAAYKGAAAIAACLRAEGYQAVSNAQIAIKPFLVQAGIGCAGRNSLVSVEGLGSRFHAQVILTDAEMETAVVLPKADARLCAGCQKCVDSCPTGAISLEGRVDIDRCLRARGEGEVVPEALRGLYGNRLLGCEICQDVCPRNARGGETQMPPEIRESLNLKRLLRGELANLSEIIGKNYARKTRIRMKAAMIAGNLRRADVWNELKELCKTGSEGEREYAKWAIKEIEEEPK